MTAQLIRFPQERVRRPDPMVDFYRDQFIATMNVLRWFYGLPPL